MKPQLRAEAIVERHHQFMLEDEADPEHCTSDCQDLLTDIALAIEQVQRKALAKYKPPTKEQIADCLVQANVFFGVVNSEYQRIHCEEVARQILGLWRGGRS